MAEEGAGEVPNPERDEVLAAFVSFWNPSVYVKQECCALIQSIPNYLQNDSMVENLIKSLIYTNELNAANAVKQLFLEERKKKPEEVNDLKWVTEIMVTTKPDPFFLPEIWKLMQLRTENPYVSNVCAKVNFGYNEQDGHHMIASEKIEIGDTILVEEPYISVGSSTCPNCFNETCLIACCNTCMHIYYCSTQCCIADAKIHQWECSFRETEYLNNTNMKFAFRTFLKALQSGLNTNTLAVGARLNIGDAFPYVHQLHEYLKDNPSYKTMLNTLAKDSCKLTGHILSTPKLKALIKDIKNFYTTEHDLHTKIGGILLRLLIICKFKLVVILDSALGITNELYPSLSLFKFSCQPNTILIRSENKIILKALEEIGEGKQIYCSYFDTQNIKSNEMCEMQIRCSYFCNCGANLFNQLTASNIGKNKNKLLKMNLLLLNMNQYSESNDSSILNNAFELLKEIDLNDDHLIYQVIHFGIIMEAINLDDLSKMDSYLPIIMKIKQVNLFKKYHIDICTNLKIHSKPIFHYLSMPMSILITLTSYLEFIDKYVCLAYPNELFLQQVNVLKAFFTCARDILVQRNIAEAEPKIALEA